MEFKTIRTEIAEEKIALLTLNRPEKKNALSALMRREISSCLGEWKESPDVGAVIISGAGGVFCAGFDLKEFSQKDLHEEVYASSKKYHHDLWNFPKPVIAAVSSFALGGGFDLMTLCDIRICAETTVFAHPEIKWGGPPLFTPLQWIVGHGLARDLCLTGRKIGANEALRIGLVSEVVAGDRLLGRAKEIAKTILEAPLSTLMLAKDYMTRDAGLGFSEAFVNEHDNVFEVLLGKGSGKQ